ncbi:MAG: FAD-binding protein [Chitinophagales bacterium]|nr:FAD-binding protein [Chitinophagales bacterium]
MSKHQDQAGGDFTRRKFLGMSAMATAAFYGASSFGLTSCKKDKDTDDSEGPIYGRDTDVVVIGSGFGGAVAGLRMSEAGLNVTMLEMGKHYEVSPNGNTFCSMLQPDERSTWLKNKTVLPFGPRLPIRKTGLGVLDRVEYDNMKIYRGTCLGGGSLVYGAMLPQANQALWGTEYPDIDYQEMQDIWYPKVRTVLPVSRKVPQDILDSKYYKYARVGIEQCEKAGMETFYIPGGIDFDIVRGEIEGRIKKSSVSGDLLYGVNSGAKNSVDRNYIPAAVGTGKMTVETMSKVRYIEQLEDGRYEVLIDRINDQGKTIKSDVLRCTYLFVTAGVVGTNGIFLRSQKEGGLANLEHIGEHIGTNGNIMLVRGQFGEDVGSEQCSFPVSGYFQPDNPYGILLAEQAPVPLGVETRLLGALAITINDYRGKFELDGSNADEGVSLNWAKNGLDQGYAQAQYFADRLNDANGGKVMTTFFQPDGFSRDFTYHPMGGVVRNLSSDAYGRLKGYKNLYCVWSDDVRIYLCR